MQEVKAYELCTGSQQVKCMPRASGFSVDSVCARSWPGSAMSDGRGSAGLSSVAVVVPVVLCNALCYFLHGALLAWGPPLLSILWCFCILVCCF